MTPSHHDLLMKDEAELLELPEARLCNDLVELVLSGEEPEGCLRLCEGLELHPSADVRGVLATCIGHLARLHPDLDLSSAFPVLDRISRDPKLKGIVEDAWADIRRFSDGKWE